LEELLSLEVFSSKEKRLTLFWDKKKIEQFKTDHGLDHVTICFAGYKKNVWDFLRGLSPKHFRQSKKRAGIYDRITSTVVLFVDIIAMASIKDCSAEKPDEVTEKLKQNLPGLIAHILCHELGHATEMLNPKEIAEEIMRDAWTPIPLLGFMLIQKSVKKHKVRSEKIAERFASRHIDELKPLFTIE